MTTFGDVLIHIAPLAPDDYILETDYEGIHITLMNLVGYDENGEENYRHDFTNKAAIDALFAWLDDSAISFYSIRGGEKTWNFGDFMVYKY